MGECLALNMESRGYTVCVYNRTVARVSEFLDKRGAGKRFIGCTTPQQLCEALSRPRKVLLMVAAGAPVDAMIRALVPHLAPGDVVIDGGNSHFADTERRVAELAAHGLLFVGCGVSGGEEGALKGPSLMPGGAADAWPIVKPILQAIAAVAPEDGAKCCEWIGAGGSGHFTKMVHNGIEYGDMQLLSEAYAVLREVAGLSHDQIAAVMDEWNKGELASFLVEITANIARTKDDRHPTAHLLDSILDVAEQKGTGKWTGQEALDRGVPVTTIVEAVFARYLSSLKDERVHASALLRGPDAAAGPRPGPEFLDMVRDSVFASKVVSYAQGFALLRAASQTHGWKLDFGAIAMTWRNGCIIRSGFLGDIRRAFEANPALPNLLVAPFFAEKLAQKQLGWRTVAAKAVMAGIPIPAMSSSLSYYDGYRSAKLPANLLQAQRDYFGAHTYERIDAPRGVYFHTNWTGHGGTTTSTPPSH
jgi:6-phosphogluconate dehydrogenase